VERPTFNRDEHGNDELPRGFFRANPASGAVTATRLVVGLARGDLHAEIDVRFSLDPKLRLLAPTAMRERYVAPWGQQVDGVARYRDFRRFDVDASWKVRDRKSVV